MFALIFDWKVVEIAEKTFPVAPTLRWVGIGKVNPMPQVGWLYDGSKFIAPKKPSISYSEISALKDDMLISLARHLSGEISQAEIKAKWQHLEAKIQEWQQFNVKGVTP